MQQHLLEHIRDQLKNCAVVSNEREFCEQWLGKSECYMRTLRFNDLAPSADALMTCATKLKWYARELKGTGKSHHAHWAELFEQLRSMCVGAVEARAERKWRRTSNGSAA